MIARELETVKGYSVNSTPQSLIVKENTANELVFYDTPLATLIIHKYISGTENEPLANVAFEVRDENGTAVGSDGGTYYTDKNGEIILNHIEPGTTLTAREVKTIEGYKLDGIPQTIVVKSGENNLTFWNQKLGSLLIRKLDSVSLNPIAGAEFSVRYADGMPVDTENGTVSSNGIYRTNSSGEILITGVTGTLIVSEEKAAEGYILNEHDRTQAVVVNPEDGQVVTFYNDPMQTLTIRKFIAETDVPIAGVKFLVTDSNGAKLGPNNGVFVTDANGRVSITGLVPGTTVTAAEIESVKGYSLDTTPQSILIKEGEAQSLSFYNVPKQVLVLQKYVDGTTTPIRGVTFLVTDESGKPVGSGDGKFITDSTGRVVIQNLDAGKTVTVKEIATVKGYSLNSEPQTITIQSGVANTLTFYDTPQTTLTIQKYITGTNNTPLAGVTFKITDGSGTLLGPNNGLYLTDKAGKITLRNLEPGTTIIAQEIQTVEGFVLDGNPQQIEIRSGEQQNLTFWNSRQGSLTIRKLDSVTKEPLAGVEFSVRYTDGRYVESLNEAASSMGVFFTNKNGEIHITGITGTLIVTEEKSIEGYAIDQTAKSQTVTVKPDGGQILYFYNTPVGGVELVKVNEANRAERIPNTTFEIRKIDGALAATVTTDKNGRAYASLAAGSYYAVEIEAAESFVLDTTPTYFEVMNGRTTNKIISNKPFSGITLHKTDSVTGQGIYAVTFMVYDLQKNPIEQLVTDNNGYARTSKPLTGGQYLLREIEPAEGYLPDDQYKTVNVTAGKNTVIEWKNTPVTAQVQITKYAAEDNAVTGQAKGTPLQGAVYEIVKERSNTVVGQITTDGRGIAATPPLPLGRYLIREIDAPAYWQLSGQTFDVTLEYAGQIIRLTDYDRPAILGVTITKTGVKEVLAGDQMTYRFKIVNTSSVALNSFYWHDKLPYDITSATSLTTGTYNQRLSYRILYKTNFNDYQVLASNLLTTNNYSYRLSALALATGEVVTDVYFDFGTVPAGFQSTSMPTLTVQVSPNAVNGYEVANRADAGGKYGNTWETGNAGWVSTVRNLNPPPATYLPKTGY